jgi:hypothetical protein
MSIEVKVFEDRKWYLDGVLHREDDLPAVELNNGTKEWWKNGLRHRDNNLHAIEDSDGNKEWYKNGERHRDGDFPACVWNDGTKSWWKNGERHRDGDLPAVETIYDKEWWKNGKLHRDGDLPAIKYNNGTKWWFKNGIRHRDNGLPVIEWNNGTNEWLWFGKRVSREEALELSKQYNQALDKVKNFRNRVKRYSAMCGLTPKKFQRVLGVLKKREFCEWWWHPDNPGGKNHLRNMEKMFNKWG